MKFMKSEMKDYSVVAGVKADGFFGELKGARRSLVGVIDGAEVAHGFAEFWFVCDRDHWIRAIVLWYWSDVRPLGSLTQWQSLRLLLLIVPFV